jgi:hypothetical protein
MANNILTATRASFLLGGQNVESFLFPDGTYGFTYEWVAGLIQQDKKILSDKKSIWGLSKLTKGLVPNGSVNPKVKVDGITYVYLTSEQTVSVFEGCANHEPSVFIPFLSALAVESLERRAAIAHNQKFDEIEANDRLVARVKGKIIRRKLTDAIKDWYDHNPGATSRPYGSMYAATTNAIYERLWGLTALQMEEFLDCGRNQSRDHMCSDSLHSLERAEANVCEYIDLDNIKPIDAVQSANVRPSRKTLTKK